MKKFNFVTKSYIVWVCVNLLMCPCNVCSAMEKNESCRSLDYLYTYKVSPSKTVVKSNNKKIFKQINEISITILGNEKKSKNWNFIDSLGKFFSNSITKLGESFSNNPEKHPTVPCLH